MNNIFYVCDYQSGAKNDTEAVKNCLSDAESCAKRTIVFGQKDYLLTEAVLLPSHTTVIIDDCMVKLADEVFDNIFRGNNLVLDSNAPYGMPLDCRPLQDIKIIGKGNAVLSGPDKNRRGYHPVLGEEQDMVGDFWGWRTYLISLSRCEGFEVSGLSLVKTCCWGMSFDLCHHGHIHDIDLDTNVKNGDGIDFRSGCHSCLVEHICGTTSDDTIACTALFKDNVTYPLNNYLYPHEPSLCLGSRDAAGRDISDITIRDVKTCGRHHAVICLAANGCKVYNIKIENITETPCDNWRESVVKLYTGYGSGYTAGDLHDISVKDVRAVYAKYGVYCNAETEHVTLANISHPKPERAIVLDHPEGVTIQ